MTSVVVVVQTGNDIIITVMASACVWRDDDGPRWYIGDSSATRDAGVRSEAPPPTRVQRTSRLVNIWRLLYREIVLSGSTGDVRSDRITIRSDLDNSRKTRGSPKSRPLWGDIRGYVRFRFDIQTHVNRNAVVSKTQTRVHSVVVGYSYETNSIGHLSAILPSKTKFRENFKLVDKKVPCKKITYLKNP